MKNGYLLQFWSRGDFIDREQFSIVEEALEALLVAMDVAIADGIMFQRIVGDEVVAAKEYFLVDGKWHCYTVGVKQDTLVTL